MYLRARTERWLSQKSPTETPGREVNKTPGADQSLTWPPSEPEGGSRLVWRGGRRSFYCGGGGRRRRRRLFSLGRFVPLSLEPLQVVTLGETDPDPVSSPPVRERRIKRQQP